MIKVEAKITSSSLHRRQALYHSIETRGIKINTEKLALAKIYVNQEITKHLDIAGKQWGKRLYVGAENSIYEKAKEAVAAGKIDSIKAKLIVALQKDNEFNIRSNQKLMEFLKSIHYKIPKITKKGEDGEWSTDESLAELALRQMIRENQLGLPNGDAALIALLSTRELLTLRSRYLNARLFPRDRQWYFLSSYNAGSGTLTGRRGSKANIFDYGGNGQNIPKHSDTAKLFRECMESRPGTIFLSVDQISAEDWPVSALAQNHTALAELKSGEDRHSKLGAFIFNIPLQQILDAKARNEDPIERYLGKKTRHANNYGMQAPRMHDSLMQEGKFFSVDVCKNLLERANAADPSIQKIFHLYIQGRISNTRTLVTPFGRERVFLGFRPNSKNGNLLNEAYSYIPQSVVGDNTGFAVEELQISPESGIWLVQEGHDSIIQEVEYDGSSVDKIVIALERTKEAFNRTIRFDNGIEVDIPVEAELHWNLAHSVKIKSLDRKGIEEALGKLGDRK